MNCIRFATKKKAQETIAGNDEVLNDKLQDNNELTASKLQNSLLERWPELRASLDTIKDVAGSWVGYMYVTLILPACSKINKKKRLFWCKEIQKAKDDTPNLILLDECTVKLEQHARLCF